MCFRKYFNKGKYLNYKIKNEKICKINKKSFRSPTNFSEVFNDK